MTKNIVVKVISAIMSAIMVLVIVAAGKKRRQA